jgi:hypothetical protein
MKFLARGDRDLSKWHLTFAWWPVRITRANRYEDSTRIWLETVERRISYNSWMSGFEYREPTK